MNPASRRIRERPGGGAAARCRPISNRAALVVEPVEAPGRRWLAVADLHLGLGGEGPVHGVPAATSARSMAFELIELANESRCRRLVIAGDVKHPIVGVPRLLRPVIFDFFSTLLGEGIAVEIALGNHDVGLVRFLPSEVEVRPSTGLVRDGVGVFHGHRWPSPEVLRSSTLLAGHLHPGIRLAPTDDRGTSKERSWLRVAIPPARPVDGSTRRVEARELIILPAFNPLAGAEALNREKPRRGRSFLFRRFLRLGKARLYLLDGTDVGDVLSGA